ncbi:N-acetyl sugar amidotransferase [Alphaproteobacteria bacterium]|nr:N-acetyl sugar amidotransferase [Alphaproteobacteria bacterium]
MKICSRCVLDETVPNIKFDPNGICNICESAGVRTRNNSVIYNAGNLEKLAVNIKKTAIRKKYDCLIGVSGGVDSSFVAHLVVELGLRPLAVHVDNGWNSIQSIENIRRVLETHGIDLETHVLNWEEFSSLQRSFLKSSIPNAEIPTDHAILSVLFKFARKYKIKYIIHGGNFATESIMGAGWMHDAKDLALLKSVNEKHEKSKLNSFPTLSYVKLAYYLLILRIKYIPILNYVTYQRADAVKLLEEKYGFIQYGNKHSESIFTRFFQSYYLPVKYSIDKRKTFYSSLILSGQLDRKKALELINLPFYESPEKMNSDVEYVKSKLKLSDDEFEEIITQNDLGNYNSNADLINFFINRFSFIKRLLSGTVR